MSFLVGGLVMFPFQLMENCPPLQPPTVLLPRGLQRSLKMRVPQLGTPQCQKCRPPRDRAGVPPRTVRPERLEPGAPWTPPRLALRTALPWRPPSPGRREGARSPGGSTRGPAQRLCPPGMSRFFFRCSVCIYFTWQRNVSIVQLLEI